ncbi:hypothetical protein LINPERPRIM_LOCUS36695 [Linum perenne]
MATALNIGVNVASHAYLESKAVKESRVLIADLCRHFYSLGRVSGTSGLYHHSGNGSILSAPSPNPYLYKPLKCCNCAPLFMKHSRPTLICGPVQQVRGAMSAPLQAGLKSSSHNSEPLPVSSLVHGTSFLPMMMMHIRLDLGKALHSAGHRRDYHAYYICF